MKTNEFCTKIVQYCTKAENNSTIKEITLLLERNERKTNNWAAELNFAISVCDKDGTLQYLNEKAVKQFKDDGGAELIGTNVIGCHPEPSRAKFIEMLSDESTNYYMREKNGRKKFIYQTP
ncbi:MAG: hypothetical protein KJ799_01270 [Bacteroidetes bacterium]|nr:hypothetical protein [Bacteroidota bacterium]MBU1678424.1 hypothetical protein [Bacteroidota bacterium]MBU2505346.1 hypothetical protein [Bacteroidota bacterium]